MCCPLHSLPPPETIRCNRESSQAGSQFIVGNTAVIIGKHHKEMSRARNGQPMMLRVKEAHGLHSKQFNGKHGLFTVRKKLEPIRKILEQF